MGIISKKMWFSRCFMVLLFMFFETHFSIGSDKISPGQFLSGNQTLTSAGGIFELGFFSPGNSQNHYIGVWYKSLPDKPVIWVANRQHPVSNTSSVLKLLEDGKVVLLNQSGAVIWSTNSTSKIQNSTIAELLDNGNFVVRNTLDSSSVIWQSFDHPTDHWIPGSKIGYNMLTNEKQSLVSWRSPENPAPSVFSAELEPNGTSHLFIWNGSKVYSKSGEWTGKIFTFVPEVQLNTFVTNLTYVSNENERYFTYASRNPNAFVRFVLDAAGQYKLLVWEQGFGGWMLRWTRPTQCEVYSFCGPFGICNEQKGPICACIHGFEPKMRKNWEMGYHSDGCVRRVSLQCDDGAGKDKFLVMPNMLFPDNSESLAVTTVEKCEQACSGNCSCNAFAYDNRCLIWTGNLFNLQQLGSDDGSGRVFHIRIAASDWIGTTVKDKRKIAWIVAAAVTGFFALFAIALVIMWRRRSAGLFEAGEDSLVLFKYRDLRSATKNFSEKLGEGAFGSVFKGTLPNSTVIAVKELRSLKQGEKQFCTEVMTIGMIQHINLVRLWGICVEASKRFLVYEYMPNGSLESVLFQKSARTLDWESRYKIAVGTARGLAYLHKECRDCIIHCDIKPENILLDAEYNPKISDFGLAKLIGRDYSRVLTTMRGTRGYLAPEWISGEAITPKADVFSYGMVLLEVISGWRNSDRSEKGFDVYFPLRVANTVHRGENVLGLLDDRLAGNAIIEELTRACKIACWCIQDDEKDRPSMGQVVRGLEGLSEVSTPPIPRIVQSLAEDSSSFVFFQEQSSFSEDLQSMS